MARKLIGKINRRGYVPLAKRTVFDMARLTDMLQHQQAPKAETDREFYARHGTVDQQFDAESNFFAEDRMLRRIEQAKSEGLNVGPNHIYDPGLARWPGDREAWIPPSGARGYVKDILESRNEEAVDGPAGIKVKREPEMPPPPIPLASDLVDECVRNDIQANPELARRPRLELREKAIEEHGFRN